MQFNSIRLKPEQSWLWLLLAAAWFWETPEMQQLQQHYIMGQWLCLPITIGLQSNDDVVCLEDKIIITIISIIRKEIVIIVIIVITSSLGNWNRRRHWPRLVYRRSGNWSTVLECSSCSNITSWVSDFVCQLPLVFDLIMMSSVFKTKSWSSVFKNKIIICHLSSPSSEKPSP